MTTQTYRRNRRSMSAPHAHLVFVTQFRQPRFTGDIPTLFEHTMLTVWYEFEIELG